MSGNPFRVDMSCCHPFRRSFRPTAIERRRRWRLGGIHARTNNNLFSPFPSPLRIYWLSLQPQSNCPPLAFVRNETPSSTQHPLRIPCAPHFLAPRTPRSHPAQPAFAPRVRTPCTPRSHPARPAFAPRAPRFCTPRTLRSPRRRRFPLAFGEGVRG